MEFIKLRTTELKYASLGHFCIQSADNNFTIENPNAENVILQLNSEPDIAELLPFTITSIDAPKEQLATNLLKDVDMRKIYDNCTNVLEQQEFGLDQLYVAECSFEPTKPRLLQTRHSPANAHAPMLAVISTYGACHIYIKRRSNQDRLWKEIGNLTKLLLSDDDGGIFPIQRSPIDLENFTEIRDFINLYVMTACAWHDMGHIVYATNAAGYIFAFIDDIDDEKNINWKFLSKFQTDLNRICYLKAFDDYILAESLDGKIHLYKFNCGKFESIERLWDHSDHMCCSQIIAQKCRKILYNDRDQEEGGGYLISFAKGAHIICLKITNEGKIEGKSKIYLPGIKITGIELLHENILIVTTITAKVIRINLHCIRIKNGDGNDNANVSIIIKWDTVSISGFDMENVQILGLGATRNKALWLFMTHANKEPMKQTFQSSYLTLFKPNTMDAASQLNNIQMDIMDPYQDLIIALRLDIWHSNIDDNFNRQYTFSYDFELQDNVDERLLRIIQIQLEISRTRLRRLGYKMQSANEVLRTEIAFLELATQIIHIILRLEYLQSLIDDKNCPIKLEAAAAGGGGGGGRRIDSALTKFQRKAAYCMRKCFYVLITKLQKILDETSKKDAQFNKILQQFSDMAVQNILLKCQDFECLENNDDTDGDADAVVVGRWIDSMEKCLFCNEDIDNTDIICNNGHDIQRCCVSFVQLPWFNHRVCLQCGKMALELQESKDLLAELFPIGESVKCTYCRCAFIDKEIC